MWSETCASHMPIYFSIGAKCIARAINFIRNAKAISNAIARSVDRRQNIVPHNSAQERRNVDAKKQHVRNASAWNKLKHITKQEAIVCTIHWILTGTFGTSRVSHKELHNTHVIDLYWPEYNTKSDRLRRNTLFALRRTNAHARKHHKANQHDNE